VHVRAVCEALREGQSSLGVGEELTDGRNSASSLSNLSREKLTAAVAVCAAELFVLSRAGVEDVTRLCREASRS
jgi:hypothetical protein